MKAFAILLFWTGVAHARPFAGIGGAAQLHYDVTTFHDIEHEPGERASPQDLVLAGARVHGLVGGKRYGYHIGIDLAAGQTARPHSYLAYDVALFPIGLAVRFFETSFITLGSGVGANGAIGTVNDALTFPLEVRFELGRATRLIGRARATYLVNAGDRKGGGVTPLIGDEVEGMLGVRLGRSYFDHGFPTGEGYFVGVTYREADNARFVGVTLGLSLDMGTPRTKRNRDVEGW